MKDRIDEMTDNQWIAHHRDRVEAYCASGKELVPDPDCTSCDVHNDYVCFDHELFQLEQWETQKSVTGKKGDSIRDQIEELLKEWHPAEIGRLVGLPDNEAKKIVREIYFGWGYTNPEDWVVQEVADRQFVLFLKQGDEWIDENGDYRFFDSEEQAISHLHASLRIWHEELALNTYS